MKQLFKLFIMIGLISVTAACNSSDLSYEEDVSEEPSKAIEPEKLADHFLEGNYESVYNQTINEFQERNPYDFYEEVVSEFNEDVDGYDMVTNLALNDFSQMQWMSDAEHKGINAYISDDDTIESLEIFEISSHATDLVHTENTYRLPMEGEWYVLWGGLNDLDNYHYADPRQSYAIDLIVLDEDNYSYDGDSTVNESYYAFGENLLAPLKGEVVTVQDGISDNTPNVETNIDQPLGNHVVIEHEHEEYSILAHFKEGSIIVSEGAEVEVGEKLGLVGNSGNSSEPHIHYQVSDGKDFYDSRAIRIEFDVEDPIMGDRIEGF